jgi:hypothetical protein
MSNYSDGRAREYKVRDDMTLAGWEPIMRASSSKGAADLALGHEQHGGALVQVGSKTKTLGPAERARLLRAAWLMSALPILAIVVPRQPIRYWLVEAGVPSTWNEWRP